ncbi:MAG: carboxypeptidase M32 [Steroidobacteraceae bacterium]
MALTPYHQLEQEFRRLHALRATASLLRWDAATMMPLDSVGLRGDQLAVLETESHALLAAPKIPRLLDRAAANVTGLDQWQQANLRRMRRDYDHAIAVPHTLIARLAKVTATAEQCWREARAQHDFQRFAPHLEEVVHLVRDRAHLLGQALKLDPYDALVDGFSPGLTTAEIDRIFATLSQRLPQLIQEAIETQSELDVLPVTARVANGKQRALALELMKALGFSFEQGRLDESDHPFTGGSPGDVRVTTRFMPQDVLSGLMAVVHETGHARYEQALPPAWRTQPVGTNAGMAVHESQSLLLEMFIGRSRPFLQYLQPLLGKLLGVSGPEWQVENLYRVLTQVRRGPIRIEADELTYPVHIMLRYELERQLLDGELAVKDLPAAWNQGMSERLGVQPANDAEGCLQDIHWSLGAFGYFPSYAIGAVIAAQLLESMRAALPGLDEQLAHGEFVPLFAWLDENIYSAAAMFDGSQLVRQVTDRALSPAPWLRYAESKYLV